MTDHPGLFNSQGIPRHLWISPRRLEPKDGLHRLATREFDPRGLGFARSPYDVSVSGDVAGRITTLSADLFPGNVLVTRVGAKFTKPVGHDLAHFLGELRPLRSAKTIPLVNSLVRATGAVVKGVSIGELSDIPFQSYFSISIQLPHDAQGFEKSLEMNRRDLVSLLIGAPNSEMLRDELVTRVFDGSEELNTKAIAELLLLNRQGFMYLTPKGDYRGPHLRRFDRTRDLATLACYARGFLRDGFEFSGSDHENAREIVNKLRQWINYPELTFDVSKSQTMTWMALLEAMLLNERLSAWDDYVGEA